MSALAALAAAAPLARGHDAHAVDETLAPLVDRITGGAPVRTGRVKLTIPRLADNGHSVPLKISVDSAMTGGDQVRRIIILSGRNPRPVIATFHLSPKCGRPEVATRVRLNGTQRVLVLAHLADGSYWSGSSEVEVTESACLDAT